MIDSEEFLLLSGIQHYVFCQRQWALIHIESQWADNDSTVSGHLMHTRAHNFQLTEKRGGAIITRDMPIVSHTMRVRGRCDVVEFHKDDEGVTLFGRKGLWMPCPLEYKRGKPKIHDADRLQLCAQAMCLEEMLMCSEIQTAYMYYGEIKRREAVSLSADLRKTVHSMFEEMHRYFDQRFTPRVKPAKWCVNCSMKNICLPKLPKEGQVAVYMKTAFCEDEMPCESS